MDGEFRSPEAYYKSLPPITRLLVTVSFLFTLGCTFSLVSPYYVMLDWRAVVKKGHVWKLLTDYIFTGPFSFAWLMHYYFFVHFSSKLEVNELFTVSPGQYLFFILFQMLSIDLLSLALYPPTGRPMMASALNTAIIYYWSRRDPFSRVGLWGFELSAYQFPFALLFLDLVLGNNLWVPLMGLVTGHLFYFLKDILPRERGIDVLKSSPKVCDEIMIRAAKFDRRNIVGSLKILLWGHKNEPVRYSGAFPRAPPPASADVTRRIFSGPGRRLQD